MARVDSASPPKPKSRSTSLNQSLEEQAKSASAKDSSDTEDEGELEHDSAPVPVPVARKVSLPQGTQSDDDECDVAVRSSPLKQVAAHDSDNEELTRDEWELSKRETVHLDEVVAAATPKAAANSDDEISEADEEENQKSAASSSSEDEQEEKGDQEKEVSEHEPVAKSNGGSHHDAASSSDEEEPEPEKAPSPRRSLQIQSPPAREESNVEGERTPSPNVPKPNPDGSVTKAYIAALNNNNNNINSSSGSPGDVVSKLERPAKPIKDITQMYVENIAKISTPPNSPKPTGRTKPAKDITQLYTGKFDQGGNAASPGAVDKLSPKKVH